MAAIGTTTAQATGIDDTTPDPTQPNKNQPAGQLPYMQDNITDNIIPLTKQAANPATNGSQGVGDTAQGNNEVLLTAQNKAVNQGANPLTPLLTQQSARYVADPNLGYNYKQYNQSALEEYDRQQSKAQEAARQKLASTSQSGELQNQYLQNQMTAAAGRQDLQAKNDYTAAQADQTNMINALAAGRATQAGNDQNTTSQIGNLATVRGMAEGERAQTTGFQENVALTNLGFDHNTQLAAHQHGYDLESMSKQYGNEMAKLMATQNFTGAEAQLQREFDAAAQTNDINATSTNIQKQLDFDKWKQENGQKFTAEQAGMNRALELSLKTMDIAGQTDLMNLKAKIDSNTLMTQQDFAATQNSLDRAEKLALQNNDTAAQIQIASVKAMLDRQAQIIQNNFTQTLTQATQKWQTGERVGTEDANKYTQAIDIASKQALQNNDIDAQKYLETQKANLQLQLQTQDMAQQEKMAFINSKIEEAKANNDVGRQEQLIGYQTTQDLEKAVAQGTIDQAKITLQGDIQKALADKDYTKATALQQTSFIWQTQENAKDRAIQLAAQALKEKNYNSDLLLEGIKNGSIDPQAGLDMLVKVGKDLGVTVTPPDPQQEQKAAQQNYKLLQYQYSLSHPESMSFKAIKDDLARGITAGMALTAQQVANIKRIQANPPLADDLFTQTMSAEGISDFNDFVNQATSGKAVTAQSNPQDIITDIVANPNSWIGSDKEGSANNAPYQKAYGAATTWTYPGSNLDTVGYTFSGGIPTSGSMFKKDGKLYVANSGAQMQHRSGAPDKQYFMAIDVVTGQTITIST